MHIAESRTGRIMTSASLAVAPSESGEYNRGSEAALGNSQTSHLQPRTTDFYTPGLLTCTQPN